MSNLPFIFARDEIELHADACAEYWFDSVGECSVVNLSEEQDAENYHSEEISLIENFESTSERLQAMKTVLQGLKGNVKNVNVKLLLEDGVHLKITWMQD
mgnify:CR=1 FL=1